MLFSSSVFLFLFLPVVLLVYYLPLRRWRQGQNVFCCWPPWASMPGGSPVCTGHAGLHPGQLRLRPVDGGLQAGGTDLQRPLL